MQPMVTTLPAINLGGFDPLLYYILVNDNYWGVTLDAIDEHIFSVSTWDSSSENQLLIFAVQREISLNELGALYTQFRQYDLERVQAASAGGMPAPASSIGIAVLSRNIHWQASALQAVYRQLPFDLDLIAVEFDSYKKYRHDMATFPFLESEK